MHFPARPVALVGAVITLLATTVGVASGVPVPASAHHRGVSAAHLPPRLSTTGTLGDGGVDDAYGDVVGDATMWARDMVLHPQTTSASAGTGSESSGSGGTVSARTTTERASVGGPARFDFPFVMCSTDGHICVHYTNTAPDTATDAYALEVLNTLDSIYGEYQASGYRMPLDDGTTGPGPTTQTGGPNAGAAVPASATDIYLADVGNLGYYGYCAPTGATNPISAHTKSAYCVLDNDYASSQFPRGTQESNLDVTAAHEFFHAVQFSYDAYEDSWFMESTAVWMEDEVFTAINDNTQYLRYGPLGRPAQSLDKDTAYGVYGGWIFFRWLTEHRPALVGQLPGLVLSMWQRAADGPSSNEYSLEAVTNAMAAAGLPMRTAFARFAAANRDPWHTYSEGAANHYPIARPTGSHTLRSHGRNAGSVRINHLAAATERFKTRVGHRHAKLRLSVDMAAKKYGTDAVVTVFLRGGGTQVRMFHLNAAGRGALTVPFSSRKVKRVELTMTNASTRMHCWTQDSYSCDGTPRDQNQLERYAASVRG